MLRGTEGASDPFWAPDSRRIGFFAQGLLKWTAIDAEAPPQSIGRVLQDSRGGAWGPQDAILIYGAKSAALSRMALAGGEQGELALGEAVGMARWPEYLPDGSLLFQTRHADPERRGI